METNLTNKLNPNRTNELLETWKGKVTQDQMLDALSFAISNLEIDPEISSIFWGFFYHQRRRV